MYYVRACAAFKIRSTILGPYWFSMDFSDVFILLSVLINISGNWKGID